MICDNCGAIVDKKERYCPNCGMEFLYKPPKKNKKHYKKSKSFNKSSSLDKPIKQRYVKKSMPESYDYSQYLDDKENMPSSNEYYGEAPKRKSGSGIGSIIILLLVALALGFTVGLIMFTSQLLPQIPGINT